jgi:formylglycine-generating enzyme required for sulfatase activity
MVHAIVVLAVCTQLGLAEDRGLNVVAKEITGNPNFDPGRQLAVVIGIDRYKEWPSLRNAVSEAKSVKQVLADRYVIDEFLELYDDQATASAIRKTFTEILPSKLGSRDSLLVFYAGHGFTDTTGTGFWIAGDGSKDVLAQNNWIPNQQIRNMISRLKAQRILILADACFSGDLLNVSRGAAPTIDSAYYRKALQLQARQVLTSGSSESVPDDSEFGHQLLNILARNDQPLIDPISMYERLRLGVTRTMPLLGTLPGNEEGSSFALFLKPSSGESGSRTATSSAPSDQAAPSLTIARARGSLVVNNTSKGELFIDGVKMGDLPAGARSTITNLETGIHRVEIKYSADSLEVSSVQIGEGLTEEIAFSWTKPRPKPEATVVLPSSFVRIPGGKFSMGAAKSDQSKSSDELPQHAVTLSPFEMCAYEVTVGEFRSFIAASGYKTQAEREGGGWIWEDKWSRKRDATWENTYFSQTDDSPVVLVTWNDAIVYCNWLSSQVGLKPAYAIQDGNVSWDMKANGFRLPTEAEWEYAARGGNKLGTKTYPGSNALGDVAWFYGNAGMKTHPIGKKKPNEIGLFDMSGNAWEWCWDWYDSSYYSDSPASDPTGPKYGSGRVIRGGAWIAGPEKGFMRSVDRNNSGSSRPDYSIGFRIARTLSF